MSTLWMMRALAVVMVLAGLLVDRVEAGPIVSITPLTDAANIGDPLSFDVNVSGLVQGDTVGFFDLIVNYNPAVLTPTGSSNAPGGGLGPGAFEVGSSFGGGVFQVTIEAGPALTPTQLSALQVPGFTLATLNFTGLAPGVSPLVVTSAQLTNLDGGTTEAGGATAQATVNPAVPEPVALLLFGMAAAFGARRLRKRG